MELSNDSLLQLKDRYKQLFEFINSKTARFEKYEVSEIEAKRVDNNGFITVQMNVME